MIRSIVTGPCSWNGYTWFLSRPQNVTFSQKLAINQCEHTIIKNFLTFCTIYINLEFISSPIFLFSIFQSIILLFSHIIIMKANVVCLTGSLFSPSSREEYFVEMNIRFATGVNLLNLLLMIHTWRHIMQ